LNKKLNECLETIGLSQGDQLVALNYQPSESKNLMKRIQDSSRILPRYIKQNRDTFDNKEITPDLLMRVTNASE